MLAAGEGIQPPVEAGLLLLLEDDVGVISVKLVKLAKLAKLEKLVVAVLRDMSSVTLTLTRKSRDICCSCHRRGILHRL